MAKIETYRPHTDRDEESWQFRERGRERERERDERGDNQTGRATDTMIGDDIPNFHLSFFLLLSPP
jgi:hypothetical protein